jgi:hypothetical protein
MESARPLATSTQGMTFGSSLALPKYSRSFIFNIDGASTRFSNRMFTAIDYLPGTGTTQSRRVMGHSSMDPAFHDLRPWNEGRVIGAKRALKQKRVWAIRFWLGQHRRLRGRALFDFAIDSKLRGCDVVKVRIGDVVSGGTHSLRRTKASIIYKATGNLRAVQILLDHAKIDSTVRYFRVDVEDALELSERKEV